jgi:hypothetical protein
MRGRWTEEMEMRPHLLNTIHSNAVCYSLGQSEGDSYVTMNDFSCWQGVQRRHAP